MSLWNERQSVYKAKKAGQIEPKKVRGGKSRKPRPWAVMTKFSFSPKDVVIYRGVSEEACKAWIEKQSRSYYISRQDQSERAHKTAQEMARERASRYWIVGPEAKA